MITDEILERIFSREDVAKVPLIYQSTMIVTPAAVENFFNVSAQAYIDVPCGCCSTVAVQNTSAQAIEVQNSNLIAVREA